MKKLILAIVLLFTAGSLSAQSNFHPGLTFNPMFTFLRAQISGNGATVSNKGVKLGYSYGLMADYMFADNYGLNFGLRFAQFNNEYTYAAGTFSDDQKLHKQYLQIPVNLKMKTNEIGAIKYYGQFGLIPSITLRTRADRTTQVAPSPAIVATDVNENSLYRPFNLFLDIGGGLEYNFGGSTSLMVGLTFENGFVNMARQNDKYLAFNGYTIDLRDKAIVLNLGIFF
jgi:hypothetical protein